MEKTIFLMEAETLLTKSKKMVRVQDLIHAPDDGKADGQGKKDILMVRISQSTKQCQVKGNFREEGEEEQAQQVLASATRVQQPFDEQKAKNRKGTPADDAQKGIELVGKEITVEEKRDAVVVGGKGGGWWQREEGEKKTCTQVVDQHGGDRNHFQNTAADRESGDPCLFFHNIPFHDTMIPVHFLRLRAGGWLQNRIHHSADEAKWKGEGPQ